MIVKLILPAFTEASSSYWQPIKHFAYACGGKKFEPLWNFMIKSRHLDSVRPLLEAILSKVCGTDKRISAGPATEATPSAGMIPLKVVQWGSAANEPAPKVSRPNLLVAEAE